MMPVHRESFAMNGVTGSNQLPAGGSGMGRAYFTTGVIAEVFSVYSYSV